MSEKLYDEEIAPLLLKAGEIAKANGLHLVALVEYQPGHFSRTVHLSPGSSFAIRLVEAAMQANGNIDALYIALARHAKSEGHSSMVLEMLGTPADKPTAAERS